MGVRSGGEASRELEMSICSRGHQQSLGPGHAIPLASGHRTHYPVPCAQRMGSSCTSPLILQLFEGRRLSFIL